MRGNTAVADDGMAPSFLFQHQVAASRRAIDMVIMFATMRALLCVGVVVVNAADGRGATHSAAQVRRRRACDAVGNVHGAHADGHHSAPPQAGSDGKVLETCEQFCFAKPRTSQWLLLWTVVRQHGIQRGAASQTRQDCPL